MSMTYGDMTREEREPVLDKAHKFINIVAKITSPEKSALFTAFPFREYRNAGYDMNLNAQHVGCSREVPNVGL
jgi:hypothetical protein